MGRLLLLVDPDAEELRFVTRDEVPATRPVHFPASEPYTILGIDPDEGCVAVGELAPTKVDKWLRTLTDQGEYAREHASLRHALDILGNRESFFRYRGFVKKVYDPSRKAITRAKVQRMFAKAIVSCAPDLRRRETIREIQAGGIFGISVLIGLMLLIAVMTIPVGGVVVLGSPFFATTLFVAWGSWAILPALAVITVGGAATYWYRKHRDVFLEIHDSLGEVMQQIEALAAALEDVFLLQGFHLYEKDAAEFRQWRRGLEEKRNVVVTDFVRRYVSAFVECLSSVIANVESGKKMGPEEFFVFLAEHPSEVRICFRQTLYDLISRQQSAWPSIEFHSRDMQ